MAQLYKQLPPVQMMRTEIEESFGRKETVTVQKILDYYNVDYQQVMFLIDGIVVRPDATVDLSKPTWAMVSMTIGG